MLRRYLVDSGIVSRTSDGSAYWLAGEHGKDVDGGPQSAPLKVPGIRQNGKLAPDFFDD